MPTLTWSVSTVRLVDEYGSTAVYPAVANRVDTSQPDETPIETVDGVERWEGVIWGGDSMIYNQHVAESLANPEDLPDGVKRIFAVSQPGKRLNGSDIQ